MSSGAFLMHGRKNKREDTNKLHKKNHPVSTTLTNVRTVARSAMCLCHAHKRCNAALAIAAVERAVHLIKDQAVGPRIPIHRPLQTLHCLERTL